MGNNIIDTPLIKQYFDIKSRYREAILLFRVGDFYEMYGEDAVTGAAILGITQTRRNNGGKDIEMAGFPYHALDLYMPRLVQAGKKVAVCDQLEDPKYAKKLVKRGVTELVTPGVSLNDNLLNCKENNFLASVYIAREGAGVSFLDISTGEFLVAEGTLDYIDKLLGNFSPKEVLLERKSRKTFEERFGLRFLTSELEEWAFNPEMGTERLLKHFETQSLKGFGIDQLMLGITAAGAIMHYLDLTQHNRTSHIRCISRIEEDRHVRLDRFTTKNLELTTSMNEGGTSLLDIIDRTASPMGTRMLRRWLHFPLKEVKPIEDRQNAVTYLVQHDSERDELERNIRLIGDLERLTSKIAVGRISPREVLQLKHSLEAIEPIKRLCIQSGEPALNRTGEQLAPCTGISSRIGREIAENPPALVAKGEVIAAGVSAELDELRALAYSGKDYIRQIQQREIERTGISSLKIAFNNVFGYYIEVRNMHKDKVPAEWSRRQTLANAERYTTAELKEYEEKVLGAEDKALALETTLFNELVQAMVEYIPSIQLNASLVGHIDCLLSFAKIAMQNGYVRPVVNEGEIIDIKGGRHPVIEKQLPPGESYIANDVYLDGETQQIMIITGPNMAGKSALLRQTALISIMAQIGSFVPVDSAVIGVVDKIFTRVGASDNISLGESTFMLEMNEAAGILNNLSERSLVLFDELGRGTSTYDGISIAWAIVEYMHEHAFFRPKTLFATHYHELNEMENSFKRIKNYNVSIKEMENKVIFLRKLVRGGSEHSFGIHVAKMAGMPKSIVKRAGEILKQLEAENRQEDITGKSIKNIASAAEGYQLSFFQLDDPALSRIRDEIKNTDIDSLTPLEALNKLNEIKKIITGK
ncbi:MAG: DNA mismatch repair protein MutS [Tannerellaceae bacterium]|jgi:DNA mismatch repair protein MutS|nr:DNA mismatch repair protein MutS [Tannerellaceae bacterium]